MPTPSLAPTDHIVTQSLPYIPTTATTDVSTAESTPSPNTPHISAWPSLGAVPVQSLYRDKAAVAAAAGYQTVAPGGPGQESAAAGAGHVDASLPGHISITPSPALRALTASQMGMHAAGALDTSVNIESARQAHVLVQEPQMTVAVGLTVPDPSLGSQNASLAISLVSPLGTHYPQGANSNTQSQVAWARQSLPSLQLPDASGVSLFAGPAEREAQRGALVRAAVSVLCWLGLRFSPSILASNLSIFLVLLGLLALINFFDSLPEH